MPVKIIPKISTLSVIKSSSANSKLLSASIFQGSQNSFLNLKNRFLSDNWAYFFRYFTFPPRITRRFTSRSPIHYYLECILATI
jgi:hypothetical protein